MTSILLSPIPTPLINTRESETPVSTVPIMIVIQVNKQIIKLMVAVQNIKQEHSRNGSMEISIVSRRSTKE